jgi:hypothetical protein
VGRKGEKPEKCFLLPHAENMSRDSNDGLQL